ncbi:hypothetical protein AMK59_5098 [Oryctes borbonicus]|uniref:Transmembrane protein 127 transmembrane region domain-containing protein n=1 Tax=Oryctes borbonicus TaxID=1629725 RepID=A0A0T6B014_9SCAR|nr:hypothetical protein AMK59_5098 [Oryctes borbonicus]
MPDQLIYTALRWLHPKRMERNLVSAALHMITITLISMSMADLQWFTISGDVCTPYLTLSLFFWFGYTDYRMNDEEYECIDGVIVNLMRVIILLCFMGIIFSLYGFFLHIVGPKSSIYNFIRKHALASTCTVIWILSIISTCYYIAILLEDSLAVHYPKINATVSYGYGFYVITAAGSVSVTGTFWTLITMHLIPGEDYRNDDACLIDDFNDSLDTFNPQAPPPPYSVPPPPYTP